MFGINTFGTVAFGTSGTSAIVLSGAATGVATAVGALTTEIPFVGAAVVIATATGALSMVDET